MPQKRSRMFTQSLAASPESIEIGPLRLIAGGNRGRYPFCHSLYVPGAGLLIDPGADRRLIPLVYAEVRTEKGSAYVSALQPQLFLPHGTDPALRQYVEGALRALVRLIEMNIDRIAPPDNGKIHSSVGILPASWHFADFHMSERTAQHYYCDIPLEAGYKIQALAEPIRAGIVVIDRKSVV